MLQVCERVADDGGDGGEDGVTLTLSDVERRDEKHRTKRDRGCLHTTSCKLHTTINLLLLLSPIITLLHNLFSCLGSSDALQR